MVWWDCDGGSGVVVVIVWWDFGCGGSDGMVGF
jgi:hypothetical protein